MHEIHQDWSPTNNDDSIVYCALHIKINFWKIILQHVLFLHRFFEIESSGQQDEIRIHYNHDQHNYISTFRFRLADNRWHKLAVTLSGNHVTLYVDCVKLYEQIIQNVDRVPPSSDIQLFVGQRNRQHALFRVSLEPLECIWKVTPLFDFCLFGSSHLWWMHEAKKKEKGWMYTGYVHVDVTQLMWDMHSNYYLIKWTRKHILSGFW